VEAIFELTEPVARNSRALSQLFRVAYSQFSRTEPGGPTRNDADPLADPQVIIQHMTDYELPPGEKWRQFEAPSFGLSRFRWGAVECGAGSFSPRKVCNLLVVDFDQIRGLSPEAHRNICSLRIREVVGGACSRPLPDGRRIVILNPKSRPHANECDLDGGNLSCLSGSPTQSSKGVAENEDGRPFPETTEKPTKKPPRDRRRGSSSFFRAPAIRGLKVRPRCGLPDISTLVANSSNIG